MTYPKTVTADTKFSLRLDGDIVGNYTMGNVGIPAVLHLMDYVSRNRDIGVTGASDGRWGVQLVGEATA